MKNVFLTIFVLLSLLATSTSIAYTINKTRSGVNVKWQPGQIDIHLDPSLDDMREDATAIVEESFNQWLDHIDQDIILNFVYDSCDPAIHNCVRYVDVLTNCSVTDAACAYGAYGAESGNIIRYSIEFSDVLQPEDLEHTALHEAGHFFGIDHSDNHDAIMYEHITSDTDLHADDIAGVMTNYAIDGTVYPAPEIKPIDYTFQGCSIVPSSKKTSLWSLFL
jgi:predicted Zn-dependent protease